jgi:hypothetical protein
MRKFPFRARAGALALVAALALGAPAARAENHAATPDGVRNVLAYGGCAAGLAMSTSPAMAMAAVLECMSLLIEALPRE